MGKIRQAGEMGKGYEREKRGKGKIWENGETGQRGKFGKLERMGKETRGKKQGKGKRGFEGGPREGEERNEGSV